MNTLIFATANENKLKEMRVILPTYEIIGLKELGIFEEIPETGMTLHENALLKATYLFEKTNMPVLSEDTGLEVDVLNGAPGVDTAIYASIDRDPDKNINKLLTEMKDYKNRNAQFRTVIAYVSQTEVRYFEGIVKGCIAIEKAGDSGFGYDPVFIPDGYSETFAQLPSSVKSTISHRARAMKSMIAVISTLK
ncbi:MAG: RdgB/HAM1 family non-canonical purine NTP pyrophosphatase [Saprospiraceae bacterium]